MHTQVGNTNLLSDQHACLSAQKKIKNLCFLTSLFLLVCLLPDILNFSFHVPFLSDPFYLAVTTLFRERLEARELLDYHCATRDP